MQSAQGLAFSYAPVGDKKSSDPLRAREPLMNHSSALDFTTPPQVILRSPSSPVLKYAEVESGFANLAVPSMHCPSV